MDLPHGVRVVRPLLVAPRPEPAFVAGARLVEALLVDDFFAGARLVEALLADDFFADARLVEALLADDFFADAFFVDLDVGGLA